MESSEFGIWAMLAFWASAIGGIALAIRWGTSKNKSPEEKKLLVKSLKKRLERGEINQAEFDKRIRKLDHSSSPKV